MRELADGRRLTATLNPDLIVTPVTIHNVLGIVEGRDSRRRDEMVVVGAHLDHDGTDAAGRIYNGADDNASGTAAVMAAAAAFARAAAQRRAAGARRAVRALERRGKGGARRRGVRRHPAAGAPGDRQPQSGHGRTARRSAGPDDWRFHGLPNVTRASTGNTLHVLGYSYTPDMAAMVQGRQRGRRPDSCRRTTTTGRRTCCTDPTTGRSSPTGFPRVFLTTGLHPDYHTPGDDTARIDFGKLTRVTRLAARAAWIVADGAAADLEKNDDG